VGSCAGKGSPLEAAKGNTPWIKRIRAILRRALWVWLALIPFGLFAAETPASRLAGDFDQLLTRGYELEQTGDWSRAVQLYEDASRRTPIHCCCANGSDTVKSATVCRADIMT